MSVLSRAFGRRSSAPGTAAVDVAHLGPADAMPSQGARGAKRSADSEALVPATIPASKLQKDASGDVLTAATVTAALPTDTAETAAGASPIAQVTQVDWQAVLARLTALELLPAQLATAHDQLTTLRTQHTTLQTQLTTAEASFAQQLKEQLQSSIARETAVKDNCQQQVSALDSTQEVLSQRVRSKNMVVHGFPDTAAVSNSAALERLVKTKIDSVVPGSSISQSITAVTRIGRPGAGNRAVLVEYSSSQAKHRTYAVSRQLKEQGLHLNDELTPKQQHAQKALDPDRVALLAKGFRTWFRHGTLWYMDRGVRRECKRGEAIRLPQTQGSPPGPPQSSARARARGPHRSPRPPPRGPFRDNGVTAPVPRRRQLPRNASLAAESSVPSYANVAGSAPITAMDTDAAISSPAAPAAGPGSSAPPAVSTGTPAVPSVTPASSPSLSAPAPLPPIPAPSQ